MRARTATILSLIAATLIAAATAIILSVQTSTLPLLERPANLKQALEYLKGARRGPEGEPKQIGTTPNGSSP